jgi:diaminopimelate decarboxylase
MTIHPAMHLLPDSAGITPEGILHIANHTLPDLAQRYGTPLYVFDRATIINACRRYREAFASYYHASPVRIVYASKAYLSPLVARLLMEQGLGLDVVSGGELMVARQAGFPMERVLFHGNYKTEDELRLSLQVGVGRIVLDNWHELGRLTRLVSEPDALRATLTGEPPGVLVRVAPDVETDTHRYLQTGHAASKFGFPLGEAKAAARRILDEGRLRLLGLHAHSGTMLREPRPYEECIERLFALARDLYHVTGWWPREISPGGGWAFDTSGEAPAPPVDLLAQALEAAVVKEMQLTPDLPAPELVIEPGRSIIARAAVALYRVGARKVTAGGITYLFIDGGMGDNIRPALYGARYTALAVERATAPAEEQVCIAGRYCESGDVLIEQVALPAMREGELLAIPGTGAYCLPMASNYNLVPRPAVLLVGEDGVHSVQVMERREMYQDILARYE